MATIRTAPYFTRRQKIAIVSNEKIAAKRKALAKELIAEAKREIKPRAIFQSVNAMKENPDHKIKLDKKSGGLYYQPRDEKNRFKARVYV